MKGWRPNRFVDDGLRRRPLFWWALAAVVAVLASCLQEVPWPLWLGLFAAGLLLVICRRFLAGATLLCAALYGWHAALAAAPPSGPGLRDGAPVTLRGVLSQAAPAVSDRQRTVLEARWRLTPGGWARAGGRYGLSAPAGVEAGDLVEVSGLLHRTLPATGPGARSERLEWLRKEVQFVVEPRPRGFARLGRLPPPWWQAWSRSARERILEVNRRTLSPAAALIANDFLIGDADPEDAELSREVAAVFRASGTLHLLVVSGTQVTLVLLVFVWLARRRHRHRWAFGLAGALALQAYYLLTDGAASIQRAASVGTVVLLGQMLERETDGENCLGLAALVILGFQPLMLLDLGFQLSFAAVWALVRLTGPLETALGPLPAKHPGLEPELRKLHRVVAVAAAASIAAHLGTAPILELSLQQSAWTGMAANIPMIVLAGQMIYFCIGHAIFGSAGVNLFAPFVEGYAQELYGCAAFFARPPLGIAPALPPPAWLFPLLLGGIAVPSLLPKKPKWTTGAVGVLAIVLFLSERVPALPPAAPTLRALDIGQGDAILLQSPGGATVLVDAGPSLPAHQASAVGRLLRGLRVTGLDAVVVSHPHADHIGGLPNVLREFPVGVLIHDSDPSEAPDWPDTLKLAGDLGVRVVRPRPGDHVRVRDGDLTMLGALQPAREGGSHAVNERSLVVRWDCRGSRFLLTGDAEAPEEESLLRWGPGLEADVLKVAHHGSSGSTEEAWLQAVHPRLAVISCGRENRFGHPGAATLERLRAAGVPVARTDTGGTVTVTVKEGRVEASSWLPAAIAN